jgi:hypothetical protein
MIATREPRRRLLVPAPNAKQYSAGNIPPARHGAANVIVALSTKDHARKRWSISRPTNVKQHAPSKQNRQPLCNVNSAELDILKA